MTNEGAAVFWYVALVLGMFAIHMWPLLFFVVLVVGWWAMCRTPSGTPRNGRGGVS